MYRRHGNKLGAVFLACDLGITTAVWLGAYFLRFTLFSSPEGVPDLRLVLQSLPLVLVLAAISYRLCGLYEVHRLKQLPRELGTVCKASGLLFVLAITLVFYRRNLYESRLALALFPVLNALGLAVARRAIWWALKYLRGHGLNYGRALIVGSGRTGQLVARVMQNNGWTGLEAVGFVDHPSRIEPTILPRLGTLDELQRVVTQHAIDHIFVALPFSRYGELPEVYQAVSQVLVEVQLVPDVPNLAGMRLQMLEIDGAAFLSLRQNPHQGWDRVAKRSMDLVLGSLALVLLSPLMLLLALAVKLTSRGPVFYRQTRTGLGGRTFSMLKFREHASGCRGENRPGLGRAVRPPLHALGTPAATLEPGRVAATVQRAGRRHEPRRSSARKRGVCRAVPPADPRVLPAAPGEVRHHRLGPGSRLAGQHLVASSRTVRFVLHLALVAGTGSEDPLANALAGTASS